MFRVGDPIRILYKNKTFSAPMEIGEVIITYRVRSRGAGPELNSAYAIAEGDPELTIVLE